MPRCFPLFFLKPPLLKVLLRLPSRWVSLIRLARHKMFKPSVFFNWQAVMNEFRVEESTQAIFSPKSTGAHPHHIWDRVHVFQALRMQNSPRWFGCCCGWREGWTEWGRGGWGTAPPAERWCKTTTGSLCSQLHSAQSQVNCSVNADQQPIKGEIFVIALF